MKSRTHHIDFLNSDDRTSKRFPFMGMSAGLIMGISAHICVGAAQPDQPVQYDLIQGEKTSVQAQETQVDLGWSAQPRSGSSYESSGAVIAVSSTNVNNPFNALVGRPRVRNKNRKLDERVKLYVLSDSDKSFLFHDNGNEVRIQFQCGEGDPRFECKLDENNIVSEIINLQTTRAPRGDVIYKDELDNTVLRIASYGGATIWWPGETEAQAASRSFSDLKEISFSVADGRMALRRANRATALLSAKTGEPIEFITPLDGQFVAEEITPATSDLEDEAVDQSFASTLSVEEIFSQTPELRETTLLADTILVVSKGMAAVSSDPTGARIMGKRLQKVSFVSADSPTLKLENGHFEVGFNAALGLKGRPTSAQIRRFLEENL